MVYIVYVYKSTTGGIFFWGGEGEGGGEVRWPFLSAVLGP